MADADEDFLLTSQTNHDDDHEIGDDTQDFLLFASLAKSGHQLPKRGEKDFEPHGTKHQAARLEASRQAMHDALDYTRKHTPKGHTRAFYYGEEGLKRDEVIAEDWRQGLDDDHVIMVESSKGPHFRTMGKSTIGKKDTTLWLLPEEALYLVERGNIDLWWPSRSSFKGHVGDEEKVQEQTDEAELSGNDDGLPMSLQAAYALLLGKDEERGKIGFERYAVYANLKRAGYVARRAPDQTMSQHRSSLQNASSIFSWLFGRFLSQDLKRPAFGPLVKPGMYRSYNSIYRQLAIIPRYKPSPDPQDSSRPELPYAIVYELWKATRIPTFAKSNPGIPDFRLAVADARSTSIPTLKQMSSLLESTPWDPPPPPTIGPVPTSQRLKHGYRNAILAVVDQGIISYLRLGETAFGEEKMYERFDRGSGPDSKRGGSSRGRGGGRGRGGRGQ
jgi:tRNA-splicing endonuclease subunit Sen54